LCSPIYVIINVVQFNVDQFLEEAKNEQRPECKIMVHDNIRGFLNWHQDWFKAAASAYNIKIFDIVEEHHKVTYPPLFRIFFSNFSSSFLSNTERKI
jgi:hypothetical protein